MMKALHARPALRSRCAAFACLALLTLAVGIAPVGGAEESARPLRVEGKRTLYQRVLTRLGAELRRTPEASGDLIERARGSEPSPRARERSPEGRQRELQKYRARALERLAASGS